MAERQESSASQFAFTVFTPTFNRAYTLAGVYRSLLAQTFRDFEWVIVDDGSTDGTSELVREWITAAEFPIRYFVQPNSGKHVAFNRAVREARGELFLSFDSDDTCVPETLEKFWQHWTAIPLDQRGRFSTLSVLCMTPQGEVIGSKYPADVYDAHTFSEQCTLRNAERWGVNRTDLLRTMPYAEFPGEKFMPEACVWNRLSARYSTRFVNEKLRIYQAGADSLSSDTVKLRARSPRGVATYYAELSHYPLPLASRMKALINYARFAFHAGEPLRRTISVLSSPTRKLLFFLIAPLGYLLYRRERASLRR